MYFQFQNWLSFHATGSQAHFFCNSSHQRLHLFTNRSCPTFENVYQRGNNSSLSSIRSFLVDEINEGEALMKSVQAVYIYGVISLLYIIFRLSHTYR